jgi:broad specificity phosphatase PhoE
LRASSPAAGSVPTSQWRFIRHGQSVANAEGWLAGHRDAALTDVGRAQAMRARERLEPADRVFCSDLRRARETLAELGDPPAVFSPRLRERFLGAWEGELRAALLEDGRWNTLLTWDVAPPGGESQLAVARRMVNFLAEHEASGVTWVVSHATAIRCAIGALDGIPATEIGRWHVGNAEVVARDVEVGAWARVRDALTTF